MWIQAPQLWGLLRVTADYCHQSSGGNGEQIRAPVTEQALPALGEPGHPAPILVKLIPPGKPLPLFVL